MAEIVAVAHVTMSLDEDEAHFMLIALEFFTKNSSESPAQACLELRNQLGMALKDPGYY